MQQALIHPGEMLGSTWRNRALIWALVKREVLGRYRGSLIGLLWSFLTPLFLLMVYTFVFSVVFKMRWNVGSDSKTEFSLLLFVGLIVYTLFAECANRAPGLILSNANYVKKVVFPLETLPWVAIGSALFQAAVSLLVWLVGYTVLFGLPHWTAVFLPLVLLPLIVLTIGVCWLLSALGVYLRDVAQFIGIVTTTLLFVSPVFYPVSALPEAYRGYLYLNPLTFIIEQVRDILFWGKLPNFPALLLYFIVALLVAWLGFAFFQKTRKGFADVI